MKLMCLAACKQLVSLALWNTAHLHEWSAGSNSGTLHCDFVHGNHLCYLVSPNVLIAHTAAAHGSQGAAHEGQLCQHTFAEDGVATMFMVSTLLSLRPNRLCSVGCEARFRHSIADCRMSVASAEAACHNLKRPAKLVGLEQYCSNYLDYLSWLSRIGSYITLAKLLLYLMVT